jgi:hypothetical protein
MKKEQSLQHLIVTEMPYELLKLLIEEKALSAFVRNLIKDTEVNSLVMPNYNKTRWIINLMTDFPHIIILRSFTWRKSEKGNDFWLNLFNKARLI